MREKYLLSCLEEFTINVGFVCYSIQKCDFITIVIPVCLLLLLLTNSKVHIGRLLSQTA